MLIEKPRKINLSKNQKPIKSQKKRLKLLVLK